MKTLSIIVPDNLEMDEQEALLIITSKLFEQGKLFLAKVVLNPVFENIFYRL